MAHVCLAAAIEGLSDFIDRIFDAYALEARVATVVVAVVRLFTVQRSVCILNPANITPKEQSSCANSALFQMTTSNV